MSQLYIDYLSLHREDIFKTYRELHQLAEPSWEEEKTSRYLLNVLRDAGIPVRTFDGHYGLVAEITGESKEVVALRADMDALVQEVDGVIKANHSCGHDAHSTMVLHAALAISACKIRPYRTIRFLFQPAEEMGEGAKRMMADDALVNVRTLLGIHLRPEMEVPYGKAAPVIVHGSSTSISGVITGLQAHASRPQHGINPIEVASSLIQALQAIRLQAGCPFSIKMTSLQSGGKSSNVIPEKATFTLDMRAQSNEGMAELQAKTNHAIKQIAALMGSEIQWEYGDLTPAAILHDQTIQLAQNAITQVLGHDNLAAPCVTPGGEDFHFYSLETPGLAATMVGLGCGLKPGLHHPRMSFNEEALIYGAQILTVAILEAAKP